MSLIVRSGLSFLSPRLMASWADATDEQIVSMVAAADAGEINLADYWKVGDTRKVHLSAMEAIGVSESHAEQDIELVLMHAGGYELASGKTCNFIVGQKNCLNEKGYMNSTSTNEGSWDGSARRTWCNEVYYNALPSTLKPIFKKFKTVTVQKYNGNINKISEDYFALPAVKEIIGVISESNRVEANALFQFDYYKDESTRLKTVDGASDNYFTRSPRSSSSSVFCLVLKTGNIGVAYASGIFGISPFGCI